ncbi:unnamed protein product [Didymodactylos carnosus]|uniref:Transposase n=1 Tax=Didymodactylos carnosus TaxID=1234261 RepID=A0A815Q1C6_9BILA|nr:unnamed protein product [Didymodactylos carnosus]CAF1456129.1 unnamed protein product [Didymodactylos carnosus]CAF4174637.1 unnamed protein product [Didymodactylos carnosus]CAF4327915.1 unnamed protein product [Didymodactylos carnosus]
MTEKILFSDEKYFDIDGIYNKQNDRIYALTREEADRKGSMHCKTQHPVHVMVWLESCYQGVRRPVIIEKGTINAARYIEEILPLALKDGKRLLGNDFISQQDGASPHKNGKRSWCKQHFPDLWSYGHWPPNSSDLNPLDYCIWSERSEQTNWSRITNKQTLIHQIKQAVKELRMEVVRRSMTSWTNRVYQMLQREGEYVF